MLADVRRTSIYGGLGAVEVQTLDNTKISTRTVMDDIVYDQSEEMHWIRPGSRTPAPAFGPCARSAPSPPSWVPEPPSAWIGSIPASHFNITRASAPLDQRGACRYPVVTSRPAMQRMVRKEKRAMQTPAGQHKGSHLQGEVGVIGPHAQAEQGIWAIQSGPLAGHHQAGNAPHQPQATGGAKERITKLRKSCTAHTAMPPKAPKNIHPAS